MAPVYSWITYLAARQILASRLSDSANAYWTDAENGIYLTEALRVWNAITETWKLPFTFEANSSAAWYRMDTLTGSPRFCTVTDDQIYAAMQYHLLEPPTGAGTWTGTNQFTLADLQGALQRRRDELIQVCSCNLGVITLPATPGVSLVTIDTGAGLVLEPRRARWIPASGFGSPVTLTREDTEVFDDFESDHDQDTGTPASWSVVTEPPLAMDLDIAPNTAGTVEMIALQAGLTFAPPAATLMGLPDDWCWLAKWGALADLLSQESEATDRARAAYCFKRYTDGIKILKQSNWLVSATINGVPVDTPSLEGQDDYAVEWENNSSVFPAVVQAGMDYVAACPVQTGSNMVGVGVTLVGNAPVPVADGDFVQVSRDVFDVILGYAQRLSSFKLGYAEFSQTESLEVDFFRAAEATNKRLSDLGLYSDVVRSEGKRQDESQPRE